MSYKIIGILGGMGPEATATLYWRIIKIFQERYGAKYDADFPKMFICNLPLPDVVETIDIGNTVRDCLVQAVKELASVGVDFIAIPCNTVSYFQEEIRRAVSIPVLSVPEEVAKFVTRKGFKKIGLLGTEMTIRTNIYGTALQNVELVVPSLEKIKDVTPILMNILSGKKTEEDFCTGMKLINELQSVGAEAVILGCTELPLLINGTDNIIDTIQLLAEVVVEMAIDI